MVSDRKQCNSIAHSWVSNGKVTWFGCTGTVEAYQQNIGRTRLYRNRSAGYAIASWSARLAMAS